MEIQDIVRAQYVKRWNIVGTDFDQSMAEHTFNVVFIARAICKHMNIDDVHVIKAALEHDLDEVITGDIPTPGKERLRRHGVDPNIIRDERKHVRKDSMVDAIVKVADTIESVYFIHNHGNTRHAKIVKDKMMVRMDEMLANTGGGVELEMAGRFILDKLLHGDHEI
jgi:5'-deoxynucleotidase YfbR-like HD superfamily hydrolase